MIWFGWKVGVRDRSKGNISSWGGGAGKGSPSRFPKESFKEQKKKKKKIHWWVGVRVPKHLLIKSSPLFL